MELSTLFPIAQEIAIHLPDGSPTDIKLKVLGHDSKAFRAVSKKYAQQMMDSEKTDVALLEAQNSELVAACIIGWAGLTENGEPLPYSAAKAAELMAMPELSFVREQVERYVAQRANFFRRSEQEA